MVIVGKAKHVLVISYWHVLVYVYIFPLGNAYSVKCAYAITPFAFALLLNSAIFKNLYKG